MSQKFGCGFLWVGEMGDAMRALENRGMDSKQDMDILAALEEMRSMKVRSGHLAILLYLYMQSTDTVFLCCLQSRHAGVSVDQMLEILKHSAHQKARSHKLCFLYN